MVSILNTTQRKFWIKSLLFVCVTFLLYFLTTSFAHAGVPEAIKNFFFETSIGIGGFFAGLGGVMFDLAVREVVLGMGDWFRYKGIGAVVTSIWTMIRDLFNILFIFSLVYIGLRTIWDADDSRTKKMLGMLIAAALLINFSLYIAKVIVDIANFTAVEIHETAISGITGEGFGIARYFITGEDSIAGAYMEVLNVSSWFDDNLGNSSNTIVYSLFAMFFLMFLGFVLAYGALMLIARFIAIIFYLMFSPLMFLGWVLPQFQSYATKWWKGFLGYCFFAPVYIFILYIGLYSLQQIRNGMFGPDPTNTPSFSASFNGNEGFTVGSFEIFLMFAIGAGFLIAATKVAGAMSNGGAAIGMNMADKIGRKITTTGGRYIGTSVGASTAGLAARAGRNSFGYAGSKISDSERLKESASRRGLGGMLSRGVLKGSRVVGDASFEARNIGGAGKAMGIGEGKKGGYKTQKDAIIKKEKEFAKSLGTLDENDSAVHMIMEEQSASKAELTELKIAKQRASTDDEKADEEVKIQALEKEIKNQDIKLKREKDRRQVGSSGDVADLVKEQITQADKKHELKKEREEFKAAHKAKDKARKKVSNDKIKKLKKELKDIDTIVKKKTGSMGYAGVVESRGIISSAIYGRINHQDKSAGKEIRKQYEKSAKESKEDARTGRIADAAGKSSK